MRVLVRPLCRLLAFLLLLVLLVGVPVAVLVGVGVPLPSLAQWHDIWRSHRLESGAVVRLGAGLFLVLWAWFAATALAELRRVLPYRHDVSRAPLERSRGPAGVVGGLVRFVAVSSVGAGLVAGGMAGVGHAQGSSPITHLVVAGDSYWDIAEGHLDHTLGREATNSEVMALTAELVERNAPLLGHRDPTLLLPGETVVVTSVDESAEVPPAQPLVQNVAASPVSASEMALASAQSTTPVMTPTTTSTTTAAPTMVAPTMAAPATTLVDVSVATPASTPSASSPREGSALPGLAGAMLLAGGALITLETRRRRSLRAAGTGARREVPSFAHARTELLLRTLNPAELLARVDVALRAAARDIAAQGAVVVAVTVQESGALELHLRGSALPTSDIWRADIGRGTWHLAAATSLEELADGARDCMTPCPALAHLGTLDDGAAVFVDLEAFGVVAICAAAGPALARAVVASLVVSPFRNGGRLRVVGVHGVATSDDLFAGVEVVDDPNVAFAAAHAEAALVGAWSAGTSTFALRSAADAHESWEPSVVVIDATGDVIAPLVDIPAGAGLAALVVGDVPGALRLVEDGDHLRIDQLDMRFRPVAVDSAELDDVAELLAAEPEFVVSVEAARAPVLNDTAGVFVEPLWDLRVRTIGQVFVEATDGSIAAFERSKSLELVVWMALHRERSTRSGARSAMWEVGVRSATFANVVSEARRALGTVVSPPDGEDWIGRTLTDDLPLHPKVITDGELLQARLEASRGLPPTEAIEVLRPGLELVTGLPFSSPCFAWVDGEGHTSSLVLLATGAALELAQHHLSLGDIEGVFWATGQGLRVLPGHEGLIAIRMRAHASRGDLAGVRLEWEQYERALAADTWSPGEPSPKLIALRRELLGQTMARAGAPAAYLSSP